MRRSIGIALALLLGAAVVVAVVLGNGAGDPAIVRGVIGSEKKPFFDDPRVRAAFEKHGLRVEADTAGSRQIATEVNLDDYAFAFPSSLPAAEKIRKDRGVTRLFSPFHSPMAVATFEPIADVLARAGLVRDSGRGYQVLDIAGYLDLAAKGTRWDELPGNTSYPARKRVLLTTTDVRTSNSAAMYLAMTSYVANGEDVVTTAAQVPEVAGRIAPVFLDQGYSQSSTEAPFEDYLVMGSGKTPMVVVYEAQYLSRLFAGDGSITPEMRLLYPSPTVLSKHTLVPFTEQANEVGRLLTEDPELRGLAAQYGFRTADPEAFTDLAARHRAPIARDLVDVVEPPAYDRMEQLITAIERLYADGAVPQAEGGS
ncbi:hypothetical protein GCM10010156_07740 [Planobispora rosea]|uniref:Extracellular solute-binding protein n=1 Tax=Planobispora rosea TaxID=35762 RepID=A0A8J3WBH6_PLARO|nr:hypothetical protein [Planobispora rosea]GGS51546.1 hypothetical protein GCM10010156_07740 [Planobispora rosea]GIH82938.1 hypothetical protein Pro02_13460 [Planobispora rosea]